MDFLLLMWKFNQYFRKEKFIFIWNKCFHMTLTTHMLFYVENCVFIFHFLLPLNQNNKSNLKFMFYIQRPLTFSFTLQSFYLCLPINFHMWIVCSIKLQFVTNNAWKFEHQKHQCYLCFDEFIHKCNVIIFKLLQQISFKK